MMKLSCTVWFFIFIFFNNFPNGQSIIQCYLCADCADPFNPTFPYTSIVTNQNYGASCIKTVLNVAYGQVVSRGTSFDCTPASTSDIKVYCCQSNLCNRSNSLKQLTSLVLFSVFYLFYLLLN